MSCKEALKELVDFIEEQNITDEGADDGDGYFDSWRSNEFDVLIGEARKALEGKKVTGRCPNAMIGIDEDGEEHFVGCRVRKLHDERQELDGA